MPAPNQQLSMIPTSPEGCPVGRVSRRLVKKLFECIGLRVQKLLQCLQALISMLADGDQLAVQGLEGLESAEFRHGRRGERRRCAFFESRGRVSEALRRRWMVFGVLGRGEVGRVLKNVPELETSRGS